MKIVSFNQYRDNNGAEKEQMLLNSSYEYMSFFVKKNFR